MNGDRQVVITGVGVVSPLGVGREPFWESLRAGRSGVRSIARLEETVLPVRFGGEIPDFDGKQYVTPRKSLKVMSREIQTAFAAARLACQDAGLEPPLANPERAGVVMGSDMLYGDPSEMVEIFRPCLQEGKLQFPLWGPEALPRFYPLWMLMYLPNMPACHIGIALDAQGPTNSIVLGEVSSLTAVAEACRLIERGAADVVVTGGTGSRILTANLVFRDFRTFSHRADNPAAASRPFDAERDGMVNGEGAGVLVLESRRHAEARKARILARVLACASTTEPRQEGLPPSGSGIRAGIRQALRVAKLAPTDIGHVNAHGLSDPQHDAIEAQAIRDTLADVPVTAPKSYFGNLGAGSGAVELIASVLALQHGHIPPTLNYASPDPACPINVVHGGLLPVAEPTALVLNQAPMGQAVTIAISAA